jgi:hypothetical protein
VTDVKPAEIKGGLGDLGGLEQRGGKAVKPRWSVQSREAALDRLCGKRKICMISFRKAGEAGTGRIRHEGRLEIVHNIARETVSRLPVRI